MKIPRKIISVFSALLILLSTVAAIPAAAADMAAISANDVSAYKGNTVSVNINAENLSNVGSLDVEIYYDSSVMTLTEIKNGSLVSGCLVSTNKDAVGVASASIASLTGLSGNGTLFTLSFTVNNDCEAGTYPIVVAVGDAYGVDLKEITITSRSATLTVKEKAESTQEFRLYAIATPSSIVSGDVTSVSVRNTSSRSFMSADFLFEYDRDLFELESVELDSGLKTENAVYSVNTNVAGCVKISYASAVAAKNYYLFKVNLKAKNTAAESTTFRITPSEVYKDNQTAYNPVTYTVKINLTTQEPVTEYPAIYTESDGLAIEGETLLTQLCLEENSNIAAGDFTVSYDPEVLECESVSATDEVAADNGIVVINKNFKEGKIKFSYVNEKGTDKALPLLNIIWKVKENTGCHYYISTDATGVVDVDFNPVTLDFLTEEKCVFKKIDSVDPDCINAGAAYYECRPEELLLPSDTYPESKHPYLSYSSEYYKFSYPGAEALVIKFNSQTEFENSRDKLYIYDKNQNLIGTYTAKQLSDVEITVPSDEFTLHLTSDGSVQKYGFKIDYIYAKNAPCYKSETVIKEIPPLGHDTVKCEAKEPTCTEIGWDAYEYCQREGCNYSTYKEKPAKGHTYERVVTAPTCTEGGYTTYTCECGENYVADEVAAKGHSYTSKTTTPATHLTEGIETFTCTCGNTYTEAIARLEEHTYTSKVTKEPTHLEEGVRTYICECNDSYTEVIEKLAEHTYEAVVTEPTCTSKGYTTYICACKDSYVSDYVGAKGHSYSSTVTTPATHLKEGVLTYTCSDCGDAYTEKIDKTTEHAYSERFIAPSCVERGYTIYTCACGDTYIGGYVSEIGHNDKNNDGICDGCGIKLGNNDNTDNCSCNCHKSGIIGIIWKILRFFYKLFKINPVCGCGVAHY